MISFTELSKQLPAEINRVKEFTKTQQGLSTLISIFENYFKVKYVHGDNVVYEVARVNIILKSKNEQPLC